MNDQNDLDKTKMNLNDSESYNMDVLDGIEVREPKSQKRKRKGCAFLLAFLVMLFIALTAIGLYLNEVYVESEIESNEVVYAHDLRMDLSKIFESDEAWYDGLSRLENIVKDIENTRDELGVNTSVLSTLLRSKNNLYKLLDRLEVYANLKNDTDLNNDSGRDMVAKFLNANADVQKRLSFIDAEVTKLPLESIKTLSGQSEFQPYIEDLNYWIEFYEYGFDENRDQLIASSQRLSEVPEEIYESYQYLTEIPEIDLYYDDFISDDSNIRKQAYLDLYSKNIIGTELLASALEGEVIANNYLAELYGYSDAFQMSLEADDIEISEFDVFKDETKKGLVLLHRLKSMEAQLKGIVLPDKLHMYDTYLPYENFKFDLASGIEFEVGLELLKESVTVLGDAYKESLESIIQAQVIDVLPRANKVEGAYTWGTYESEPYVLLNYYGNFQDVLTMGHELGHAVHHEFSRNNQPYNSYDTSILIAEMVATTNEALMFETMLGTMLENDSLGISQNREAILWAYAKSIEETIYDQLLASEFQRSIHEDVKNGVNLDADRLNKIWSDLVGEYYGPSYEVSQTDGFGWTDLPHLYWGFYVQKYAIGYSAGISNAHNIIHNPDFKRKYIEMLESGGSKSASEQLVSFGYGPSGELAVHGMLDKFEWILDELEELIK